jgi:hypothetical protein
MRLVISLIVLPMILLLPSCIDWQRQSISEQTIYELLSQRNISALEQKIAHFERLGESRRSVDFAKQWIYFANCQPVPPQHDILLQYQSNPSYFSKDEKIWVLLALQLRLEEYRRLAQSIQFNTASITPAQYLQSIGIYQHWFSADFFQKSSPNLDLRLWAQWPKNAEGWPDEVPNFISIENQCNRSPIDQKLEKALIPLKPDLAWPFSLIFKEINDQAWKELYINLQQLTLIDQILAISKKLTLDTQAWKEWQWWVYYHQSQVYLKLAQIDIGWPIKNQKAPTQAFFFYQNACQQISTLLEIKLDTQDIKLALQGMRYLKGICTLDLSVPQDQFDPRREALHIWKSIDLDLLDEDQLVLLQYQRLKYLTELQEWQECTRLESALPKSTHPIYTPFVYLLGLAFDRSGQEDKFLAFGLKLFRDKSWRKDPFLRALFYVFVRKLTKLSFEGKVIELLEDLGDRRFTYERVLIFSEIALDEGDVEQGISSAQWLLAHHDHAESHPQYHSLLAFAYFLQGNQNLFKKYIKEIIGITPALLEAIPQGRRAKFFETRDIALTQLLRLILPKIAELENRQQKDLWLKLMIEEIQNFIRLRAESKAKEDLLSLYRTASQMLSNQEARAYPELIGKNSLPTLVLGEARLHSANLTPFEPRYLRWLPMRVWSLLMIPSHQNPYSWTQSWIQAKERN